MIPENKEKVSLNNNEGIETLVFYLVSKKRENWIFNFEMNKKVKKVIEGISIEKEIQNTISINIYLKRRKTVDTIKIRVVDFDMTEGIKGTRINVGIVEMEKISVRGMKELIIKIIKILINLWKVWYHSYFYENSIKIFWKNVRKVKEED